MGRPGTSVVPLPGETVDPSAGVRPVLRPRLVGNAPDSLQRTHPPVTVLLEMEVGSDEFAPSDRFVARNITDGMDGADFTAQISAGLSEEDLATAGTLGDLHMTHLLDAVNADRRVRIAQVTPLRVEVLFQGWPIVPTVNWSDRDQGVPCHCLDEGQEILRMSEAAQITGRRMRWAPLAPWDPDNPDDRLVTALPAIFNAGNRPNRSAQAMPFTLHDRVHRIHLFVDDDSLGAEHWSFAEALRYIVFMHVLQPGLAVTVTDLLSDTAEFIGIEPAPDSPDPFTRRLSAKCEDLGVASMDVEQALVQLCDAAGLHFAVDIRNWSQMPYVNVEHHLRVWATIEEENDDVLARRRMVQPVTHDVPREAPFTDMTGRSTLAISLAGRAQQASLSLDRRAITAPRFLGGIKTHEVSLLVRPGWLPHEMIDNLAHIPDLTTPEELEAAEAARQDALSHWLNQFEEEFEGDETRTPRSVYHSGHPDHHTVSKVGRLWVFPDDHFYVNANDPGTSPYTRNGWPASLYSPYDLRAEQPVWPLVYVRRDIGGGIAEAGPWVPRRRPFGDLIGRLQDTADQAPRVEINFQARVPYSAMQSDGWVPFAGQPYIDTTRGALWLKDANLLTALPFLANPEDGVDSYSMLAALIWGTFAMRVTCTVRGDDRLAQLERVSNPPFQRRRHAVMDTGFDRFVHRNRRGQNSDLNSQPIDPNPVYEDRLDEERLARHARREARILGGETVSGSIEIPHIDGDYRVGDSFRGAKGMGITFHRYPEIVRRERTWDPDAGPRTVVHVTDLRDASWVGTE